MKMVGITFPIGDKSHIFRVQRHKYRFGTGLTTGGRGGGGGANKNYQSPKTWGGLQIENFLVPTTVPCTYQPLFQKWWVAYTYPLLFQSDGDLFPPLIFLASSGELTTGGGGANRKKSHLKVDPPLDETHQNNSRPGPSP